MEIVNATHTFEVGFNWHSDALLQASVQADNSCTAYEEDDTLLFLTDY